jgi:hypothetical protein
VLVCGAASNGSTRLLEAVDEIPEPGDAVLSDRVTK